MILGIVYSACLPIHMSGSMFMGVTCIDILMKDLVEDLVSYPCFQHMDVAYSFMLDSSGRNISNQLKYVLTTSVSKDRYLM